MAVFRGAVDGQRGRRAHYVTSWQFHVCRTSHKCLWGEREGEGKGGVGVG